MGAVLVVVAVAVMAGPVGGAAGATTTTSSATTIPATTTAPLTRAQAALCSAYDKTVRGAEPLLAFDGSSKDAPLSLLGQARVSGVGVRRAVQADLVYLGDLVRLTPVAQRGVLAPYVAAYRQVLGVVVADHDNLTRANTDRRLARDDGPVVTPPAGAATLIAGLVKGCPTPGRTTRPGPGSRTASR
jgi:hypothetical protein